MPYEDVKVQCHFCKKRMEGNQRFMVGGKQVAGGKGRIPRWLKEKLEHQWYWNGLSNCIRGEYTSFDFYLCPRHNDQPHYEKGMKWAQKQLDGQKALAELVV